MNHHISGTYTDLYQLAMGQAYFLNEKAQQPAAFDYFFRKLPFNSGYVVFAGLADFLKILENLRFTPDDINYLRKKGFDEDFLKVLQQFRFKGTIYAPSEGDVVFPTEPILRVEGTMLETQLIETLLLNILNFQSLIATKAARMRFVAPKNILSEFGLRRAQGLGGVMASRAAIIGGFDSTSNVYAAKKYGIEFSGTMAHSFIQMYGDELKAFRKFAKAFPSNCILLVDTYNTLKSGVPNAIKVAKEMEQKGHRLRAIRLDSGDLSYFGRKARKMLDDAGLDYVKIAASNQLDEYVIRSLKQQKAPIDIFGVGTNLATGQPDSALDGVYKLIMADDKPRIKVSDNLRKMTLPGKKQVKRFYNKEGNFFGLDGIIQDGEDAVEKLIDPFNSHRSTTCKGIKSESLLNPVVINGKIPKIKDDVEQIKQYSAERLALLPEEYKRFENPHIYKVGISIKTQSIRDDLRQKHTVK